MLLGCMIVLAVSLSGCGKKQENVEEKQTEQSEGPGNYFYEVENQKIYVSQPIKEAVEILGDGYEYYEAPGCAGEGMDIFYYYPDLTIEAVESEGEQEIKQFYFKNDTVVTPEGLRIGSTYEETVAKYGDDFELNGNAMEYGDGNALFIVELQDGKVLGIRYTTK